MRKYTFSGHESFPCKSLWLKKGYDFVVSGCDFYKDKAVIQLGVGKNMVSSIRYWLRVYGICDNNGQPTELGHYLFNDVNGKDCYIEDLATLWLLHFNLVFLEDATLYSMLFRGLQRERSLFDREQIQNYVKLKMAEEGKQSQYNVNTIKKDIGVLLQNYVLPRKAQSNEDYSTLLIDLDLIRQESDGKGYYFNVEGKRQVTKEVFMYGLLKLKQEDNTIAYETIKDRLSLIFCMNDQETIAMLKDLAETYSEHMTYNDVAGIRQIQFVKDLDCKKVLYDYYENI